MADDSDTGSEVGSEEEFVGEMEVEVVVQGWLYEPAGQPGRAAPPAVEDADDQRQDRLGNNDW